MKHSYPTPTILHYSNDLTLLQQPYPMLTTLKSYLNGQIVVLPISSH